MKYLLFIAARFKQRGFEIFLSDDRLVMVKGRQQIKLSVPRKA